MRHSLFEKVAHQSFKCAAIAAFLFVAACYETNQEIIRIDQAAAIAGLAGSYSDAAAGTTTEITTSPYSNEYHYHQVDENGHVNMGKVRIIPLRDSIYLVQSHRDGEANYILTFFEFYANADGSKGYDSREADATELAELAALTGVTLGYSEDAYYRLSGSPENILAFLLEHKRFVFVSPWDNF